MEKFHQLLIRQLKRNNIDIENLESVQTEQILKLIEKVSLSYDDFSDRIQRLERAIAASSNDIKDYLDKLKAQEDHIQNLNKDLTENVLKRYLPPDLVNQIVKGEYDLDGQVQVKLVTVMFCDLCNFTGISDELGPYAIAKILNQFLAKMTEVIFNQGGTIDKFIGDGIMILFGAPISILPEDQVIKAKDCAIDMMSALRSLQSHWVESYGVHLQMRIGIHQGPAIVGNFGGNKRADYTAIGPTVNMASRLESVANPGEVFFTGIVRDFLPSDCWEKAGDYSLKGLGNSSSVYRLKESILYQQIKNCA